jgi:hypothetical protein
METFGIVIRDPHIEHAGRFTVAERAHGAPQVVDLRLRDGAGRPGGTHTHEHGHTHDHDV